MNVPAQRGGVFKAAHLSGEDRVVNGNKELTEKLGQNDPGRRFQELPHVDRRF